LLFHAQSVIVNILELSIMNATAPLEICISGGGCALAALNCSVLEIPYFFIGNSVRHEAAFVAHSTRLKLI
jgi:hypothetical protein